MSGARRTSMLTRSGSVSVASSLQAMPDATSVHSGSRHASTSGSAESSLAGSPMRSWSRPHIESGGRRISSAQDLKRSATGCSDSRCCRHSAQLVKCSSTRLTSPCTDEPESKKDECIGAPDRFQGEQLAAAL